MTSAIRAEELTQYYGRHRAIENVAFDIKQGEVVGYLGVNGAGKTTTLRILAGLQAPTAGKAFVGGQDVASHGIETKRMIGYLPETAHLFESLSGYEYLQFVGRIYGLDDGLIDKRIQEWADFSELTVASLRSQKIASYSKGTRQKVSIGAALIHQPRIWIFDEPLNGLDSHFIINFKKRIRDMAAEGVTLLFSSHLIDVVENLCQRVLILHDGGILADSGIADLKAKHGGGSLESIFEKMTAAGTGRRGS